MPLRWWMLKLRFGQKSLQSRTISVSFFFHWPLAPYKLKYISLGKSRYLELFEISDILYYQWIIQEFNLGVSSHVSIILSCELCSRGSLGGAISRCCKPPYFAIPISLFCSMYCFAIYFILLNNNFLPKI